jgi:O-antigen ligase
MWDEIIAAISDKPIFGWGVDSLRWHDARFVDGPHVGERIIQNHAHNMFLHIWMETGFVGSMLTAMVILVFFWRLPSPDNLGPSAGRATLGLWWAVFLAASGSFSVWSGWWWSVILLLIGFIVLFSRHRSER